MTTASAPRALLVAVAALALSCRGSAGNGSPDAGRADAAPPKPVVVRTAAAGELLADLDDSKVMLTVIKDRDLTLPVLATVMLRDGRLVLNGPGQPSARLSIDLNTYDSKIPLRNTRVKQFFFETSGVGWDTAELSIPKLPDEVVATLRERKRVSHAKIEGELKLHGKTGTVSMVVDAGYEAEGALVIKSAAPIELKVSDFGLTANLQRLSSICMHDSIDDIVKVEVSLEFPSK